MFKLNDKTKNSIKRETGLEYDRILSMEHDEIRRAIEKKIGKKLVLEFLKGNGFHARGSVYLQLKRVLRESWLNKQISRI